MSIQLRDTDAPLSQTLLNTLENIDGDTVTLRRLFEMIGEQGLLLLCMLLSLPFLFPVSIPGVSTVFGTGVILIGIAITLNRLPWLPSFLADRQLSNEKLMPVLQRGAKFVARFDTVIKPRVKALTNNAMMNRVNGLMMVFAGLLLIVPLGLIPFSNTLPAVAIILLAIGMLQRDGVFVLGGYLMIAATVIYFGALAIAAIAAGQGLASLLG